MSAQPPKPFKRRAGNGGTVIRFNFTGVEMKMRRAEAAMRAAIRRGETDTEKIVRALAKEFKLPLTSLRKKWLAIAAEPTPEPKPPKPKPELKPGEKPLPPMQTTEEFVSDFRSPDWFVDGVLQRKYLYAMTGVTGHGKTATAMALAMAVVCGGEWGGVACDIGDVVYFAGENPDDIRWRWIAMGGVKVHFISGTQISLREDIKHIKAEIERLGIKPALIIVDTKAAFFEDDDEDKNVPAINQAADLRELTNLPGDPAVLVLCHPTKWAKQAERLVPRGGGAFLNSIDGNLTCMVDDGVATIDRHPNKRRGPHFDPLEFILEAVELPLEYMDTKGRLIKSVVAKTATEAEMEEKQKERNEDEERVQKVMDAIRGFR